jgi:hypothetical protein
VAAWTEDIFCRVSLMKNQKITKNLTTPEAREKMGTDLKPLKCEKKFLTLVWLNYKQLKLT